MMRRSKTRGSCLVYFVAALLAVALMPCTARAQFRLGLNLSGLSDTQRSIFDEAAALWDEVIIGYQEGVSLRGITITGRAVNLGGAGGTLASAGITGTVQRGGFRMSTRGTINLDTNDLSQLESSGRLLNVIAHEIGHILGIGSLWVSNGLYVNDSGRYTGTFGVAAFREEFRTRTAHIPVELSGGPGTANAHWDETFAFRTDDGEPLANELMTGFLSGSAFLSNTTVQSLRDLGYEVIDLNAVQVIPGDIDGNGVVDAFDTDDFELLLADRLAFLEQSPDADVVTLADLDANGVVDAFDVDDFEALIGGVAISIPTPATATFLAIGVGMIAVARRGHVVSLSVET